MHPSCIWSAPQLKHLKCLCAHGIKDQENKEWPSSLSRWFDVEIFRKQGDTIWRSAHVVILQQEHQNAMTGLMLSPQSHETQQFQTALEWKVISNARPFGSLHYETNMVGGCWIDELSSARMEQPVGPGYAEQMNVLMILGWYKHVQIANIHAQFAWVLNVYQYGI